MLIFLLFRSSVNPQPKISLTPPGAVRFILPLTHKVTLPVFISPIENTSIEEMYKIISSNFGLRVLNKQVNIHKGIDLIAKKGTKIRAAASGVVTILYPPPNGYYKGHPEYGGLIIIDHGGGACTFYAHLSETYIIENQLVTQGQNIGVIGDTGIAYGIHLHFEIILDPKLFYLAPEQTPDENPLPL